MLDQSEEIFSDKTLLGLLFLSLKGRVLILVTRRYLDGHGGQVPHVDDDGPAGHHAQHVADHVVLAAVPESISKPGVVLKHRREG